MVEGAASERTLADAYASRQQLARAHYENFPVASVLLPAAMRPHVAAVYAFARLADDRADEGERSPALRIAELDAWGARLRAAIGGTPVQGPHDRVFVALAHTVDACALPVSLLEDLLCAVRLAVTVGRYATWPDVLDYCRRSANPVGRLVLRIAGYRDGSLDGASDAVCTALQLANFWQDLAVDWRRGRLYVPAEIWQQEGASETDLDAGRMTPAWRAALREVATRTHRFFEDGRPVCDGVTGRLRWELRATWLGGTRILEKLEAADYDVFANRPTLGLVDAPVLMRRLVGWTARP
jgi:squalene synthase HpnC